MAAKGAKGYVAEENLRLYFLSLGYFVLRGVKLKREGVDLTDIDLLLLGKSSPLSRERINVDSKNRKSPQAAERIFFANGIKNTLGFERCIVATTSNSLQVSSFAEENSITFLDGNFLKKLTMYADKYKRITEDAFLLALKQDGITKSITNYIAMYETAKSRLAFEIDFSAISQILLDCKYFSLNAIKDFSYRVPLCRCFYYTCALFLVALDYVSKDLVILSDSEREKRIFEGFMFGSLGKKGSSEFIDKAFSIVKPFTRIDDTEILSAKKAIIDAYSDLDAKILGEYFSKNSNIKELFKHAKEFEQIAFAEKFINPNELPPHIRSVLFVLLDYLKVDRNIFVDALK